MAGLALRSGAAATGFLIAVSLPIALGEAIATRALRPLAVTLRRHVFVLLLVPCALLSLIMTERSSRGVLVSWAYVGSYLGLGLFGVLIMGGVSVFAGGMAPTVVWAALVPALLLALMVAANPFDYTSAAALAASGWSARRCRSTSASTSAPFCIATRSSASSTALWQRSRSARPRRFGSWRTV